MKLVESSNEYIINEREYFYNLNTPSYAPTSILANIPKLMPRIAIGSPTTNKDSISGNIFCNDDSCKPKPDKVVTTQNYITLAHLKNQQPAFWSTSKGGKMIKQQKHIVEITCHDIRQMHFVDDL